jgi:predicted amidohydrolase YtcJ
MSYSSGRHHPIGTLQSVRPSLIDTPRMLLPWLLLWLAQVQPVSARSLPLVQAAPARSVLYHHGRIVLNDGRGTIASALLVQDGRVAAVGRLEDVEKLDPAHTAQRIDLGGATALPGLQDAHGHLAALGESLESLDLTHVASYEELIQRVSQEAQRLPEGTWIVARGWDESTWPSTALPHHILLSAQVPKHPVFLERRDGHAALVNHAALVLAKLDGVFDAEPKVQGGRVVLDEEHRASGILLEAGMDLVRQLIPPPDAKVRQRRLLAAQQHLLARGLTAVHDMGTDPADLQILKELRASHSLRLRVVAYVDGDGVLDDKALKDLPVTADEGDWLSAPGVYMRADGGLSTHCAALIEEYKDAHGERGMLRHTEKDLVARVALVARHQLQPAVESVGDRATRLVLDTYDTLMVAVPGFRDLRPRIECAQVVSTKDWPRFPALGVVPSMQPIRTASERTWLGERLGERRLRGASFWRELAPALGRLAFGSDCPAQPADPLRGILAAGTPVDEGEEPSDERMPPQRLDFDGALQGFTTGAAYAALQDDRRGRLEVGFAADMSVFAVDRPGPAAAQWTGARVDLVVINGEVVYRAR